MLLGACAPKHSAPAIPGGDPDRGAQATYSAGCGTCHHIPGIPGAVGLVGPPLDRIAERAMLAGQIPNTPANMLRWIRDPQSVEPNTAMPNLQLGDRTARDIVAYLFTIH